MQRKGVHCFKVAIRTHSQADYQRGGLALQWNHTSMTVDICQLGVVMMVRPLQPLLGVVVDYSEHDVGMAVKLLRDSGFGESFASPEQSGSHRVYMRVTNSLFAPVLTMDGSSTIPTPHWTMCTIP